MSEFTEAELQYLRSERRLGRLATVGPRGDVHVTPVGWSLDRAASVIEVGGRALATTKKFRDVARGGRAAIVIDDVLPPWRPRGVEVRGRAEAVEDPTPVIRIHPERIVSWGLDDTTRHTHAARDVAGSPSAPVQAPQTPTQKGRAMTTTAPEPTGTATATTRPRRRTRLVAVTGAVTAALTVWAATEILLGVDLRSPAFGAQPSHDIGAANVVVAATAASLAGWVFLAVLERFTSRARVVWTVTALLVLLVSLGSPLGGEGISPVIQAALVSMHLAVAAVLTPVMGRTSTRSAAPAGDGRRAATAAA
ncbi:MAG TPA: PPOX class F420-dependent oxidoreductase [Egibacteraceae bacterium]|nr:PPOX class F420-dependent oxidoreductase [Egibacteraceae bacterium]